MYRIKSLLTWVTLCAASFWPGSAQQLRSTAASASNQEEDRRNTRNFVTASDTEAGRRGLKEDEATNGAVPPPAKQAPPEISGERRTVDNVLMNFQLAKARLLERLKNDYGEKYFDTLFMDDDPAFPMPNNQTVCTIGRNAFLKGSKKAPVAWARTVRKMKINLLQYLIEDKVQDFVWATA